MAALPSPAARESAPRNLRAESPAGLRSHEQRPPAGRLLPSDSSWFRQSRNICRTSAEPVYPGTARAGLHRCRPSGRSAEKFNLYSAAAISSLNSTTRFFAGVRSSRRPGRLRPARAVGLSKCEEPGGDAGDLLPGRGESPSRSSRRGSRPRIRLPVRSREIGPAMLRHTEVGNDGRTLAGSPPGYPLPAGRTIPVEGGRRRCAPQGRCASRYRVCIIVCGIVPACSAAPELRSGCERRITASGYPIATGMPSTSHARHPPSTGW